MICVFYELWILEESNNLAKNLKMLDSKCICSYLLSDFIQVEDRTCVLI